MAQTSLSTGAARKLATTTKTAPQMRGITPRWLMRMLPWVAVEAGMYRVNRRLRYDVYKGFCLLSQSGGNYSIVPGSLAELPLLRGYGNEAVLTQLAALFVQSQVGAGEAIAEAGAPISALTLLAHGRALELSTGEYGELVAKRTAGEGDGFGVELLDGQDHVYTGRVEALSDCVLLRASKDELSALLDANPGLAAHIEAQLELVQLPQDKYNEAAMALATDHGPESPLNPDFIDYHPQPTDIELSVAQAILRVNTRVMDLHSQPMDQLEQQLRLTIEALRERQEHELVNNPNFGLLAAVDHKHYMFARPGPPTPQELDDLLCRCRQAHLLLAHPRTIAAFGRQCSRQGVYPEFVELDGRRVHSWHGVPLLPCDKIPITATQTSSILCLRLGEDCEGVVGLHQPGIPDEVEPSLNVRFMGTDDSAVNSYLVSAYYSLAVLIPSAVNILAGVELR